MDEGRGEKRKARRGERRQKGDTSSSFVESYNGGAGRM